MPATQTSPPNPFLRTDRKQPAPQAPRGPQRFGVGWGWLAIFLGLLLVNVIVTNVLSNANNRITIPYTTFKQQVASDNVRSVTVVGDVINGHASKPIMAPDGSTSPDFQTIVPRFV